jgi:hypothetical protein
MTVPKNFVDPPMLYQVDGRNSWRSDLARPREGCMFSS